MNKTSYCSIAAQLTEKIQSGDYRPMDRLPPERRLAEIFQASRNTVREAIRTLAEKGIVESRPGAGTFVATDANQRLASTLFQDRKQNRLRLKEVFELRKMLEPQIAALAASRISDAAVQTLEDIVRQQEKSVEAGKDATELDELFHRCLVRATGNCVLLTVYEKISGILSESRSKELQTRERTRLSLETHKKITAALKSRDMRAASDLMHQHMTEIETTTKKKENPSCRS
ncbi:MAG: FadR/GntR family transcriptional regulator [Pseudomonadota bacterium]